MSGTLRIEAFLSTAEFGKGNCFLCSQILTAALSESRYLFIITFGEILGLVS